MLYWQNWELNKNPRTWSNALCNACKRLNTKPITWPNALWDWQNSQKGVRIRKHFKLKEEFDGDDVEYRLKKLNLM